MNLALPSEEVALVDAIDPDAYGEGAVSTAYIAAKNFHSFMATVYAGTMASNHTLDAKIQQATTSGGGSVKDLTGASITQLTAAGTDSDKQAIIQFRTQDLDVANGFDFVRLTLTLASTASPFSGNTDFGAALYGFHPRHAPASDNDNASVDEIVTV